MIMLSENLRRKNKKMKKEHKIGMFSELRNIRRKK